MSDRISKLMTSPTGRQKPLLGRLFLTDKFTAINLFLEIGRYPSMSLSTDPAPLC